MKTKSGFKKGVSPIKILPLGFLGIILVGTVLLALPAASSNGIPTPLFDCLFTATSASCVTGLVVLDTGTHFSAFGQAVMLTLIQLGGLGFMTFASMLFAMMRKQVSLKERMTIAEGLGENQLQGVVRLGLSAVKLTFGIEAVGALLLSLRFVPQFGWANGIWRAVFHSISAFCNAGFDLMGNYASLVSYYNDPLVCLTICALIISGGLGFAVLASLGQPKRKIELRLHTRLVLVATAVLTVCGTLLFFAFEYSNPATLSGMTFPEKLLNAFFQSVTCRTAGFNTIDQAGLRDASKLLSCLLMFIGAAPAGTAGGVKVTTLAVLLLTVRAHMRGHEDTELFGRRITLLTLRRALCLFVIGLACALVGVTVISLAESGSFIDQLYEIFSALGTVGLTVGVTASAGVLSRCVLILFMYVGRVGLLTMALSLTRSKPPVIRYPEGHIMVG